MALRCPRLADCGFDFHVLVSERLANEMTAGESLKVALEVDLANAFRESCEDVHRLARCFCSSPTDGNSHVKVAESENVHAYFHALVTVAYDDDNDRLPPFGDGSPEMLVFLLLLRHLRNSNQQIVIYVGDERMRERLVEVDG